MWEGNHLSRRGKIRLISFFGALFVSLVAAVAACHVGAGAYTTRLDAQTERAFGEAYSAVERLQRSLDACAFATDAPMQSALCTQLYADASAAETALSALPVELDALENVSREISVAGDYAFLLSRAAASGNTFSQDALSILSDFSETIHPLADGLSEIRQAFAQGDVVTESRGRLLDALDNLTVETEQTGNTLNVAFHDLAASFPESEPLLYDGKFSDHEGVTPAMLAGKPVVTQEQAREAAAGFLQCEPSTLKPLGFRSGALACWRFSLPEENAVISVTARGGEVLQFLSDRVEGGEADPEQAKNIAAAFLSEHGYPAMECIEASASGSEVTLTMAPLSDQVLCLPDRITMRICPATDMVTAFDASDYLRYHAKREFAQSSLDWTPPESLSVESQREVVLLSPGGQERDCVEYLCKTQDGQSVRIDVNAETGLQERILLGEAIGQTVD